MKFLEGVILKLQLVDEFEFRVIGIVDHDLTAIEEGQDLPRLWSHDHIKGVGWHITVDTQIILVEVPHFQRMRVTVGEDYVA